METITSVQNSRIKNVVTLREKSRERVRQQLFPIEGKREIGMAVLGGYLLESLFVCEGYGDNVDFPAENRFDVSKKVFEKISCRENPDGFLALAQMKNNQLSDIKLSVNPFVIVLESIEKPGNLGAALRTADAAAADILIVCDPKCDIYNPNVIRSSLGCVFVVNTLVCSSEEAFEWLKTNQIQTFAAELEASQWYYDRDFTRPSAIIMGTEATGLSDFWLKNADCRIKIPMNGKIDSLNVSVSTAILTFEALRQRKMLINPNN